MIYNMKLKSPFFERIEKGEKIYEIRLNDEKRKKIKIGDYINLKKEPELTENFTAQVVGLDYFSSFKEVIGAYSPKEIGFEGQNKDEIERVYYGFYSKTNEKQYGVVAIKVKVLKQFVCVK